MPRERLIGTCSVCGQEKPLFDVKNKLCGSCAGKKGGGRPKALVKRKEQETPLEPPSGTPPQAPAQKSDSSASEGNEKYLCDACGKEVRYGQRQCRCGVWCDWRGSAVQDDPDLVICPECGAICGHVENASKCPHCNYGG